MQQSLVVKISEMREKLEWNPMLFTAINVKKLINSKVLEEKMKLKLNVN